MIFKGVRVSGESDDILDFSELKKMRLKNSNVQSCDTWGERERDLNDGQRTFWEVSTGCSMESLMNGKC